MIVVGECLGYDHCPERQGREHFEAQQRRRITAEEVQTRECPLDRVSRKVVSPFESAAH
jgi:hypothetical protein